MNTMLCAKKYIVLSSLLFCSQLYSMRTAKKATKRVMHYGQQLLSHNQRNGSHTAIVAVPITEQSIEHKKDIAHELVPGLLNEISLNIFAQKVYENPSHHFDSLVPLKLVCKAWNQAISTKKNIIKILDISAMHFAAMTDNAQEIVALKLQGHSVLEQDQDELCPMHYALIYDKVESFKVLSLGRAIDHFNDDIAEYIFHTNSRIHQLLLAKKSLSKVYTLDHLKKSIRKKDYYKTLTILFFNQNLALENVPAKKPSTDRDDSNNNFDNLFLYFLKLFTENYLYTHAIKKIVRVDVFFERLKDGDANPNILDRHGLSVLHYLCYPENKNLYSTLIELLKLKTIDVNIRSLKTKETPLHTAVAMEHHEAIAALLETDNCDIDPIDISGYTPLCYAASYGCYKGAQMLIKKGADITIKSPTNQSLLHLAAITGQTKILDILLTPLKQHLEDKNNRGYTPLISCACENPENAALCIQTLIKAGANKEARTNNGQVALHYAAGWNYPEVTKALLENGANVNVLILDDLLVDGILYTDYTPLHLAAQRGHCDIIKLLLQHGANTKLKTATGKTALDLAREYEHEEAVKLLL